jgi:N-acyl-D-aspartate/D-glutamate deacylase
MGRVNALASAIGLALVSVFPVSPVLAQGVQYDLVIRGGRVVDGTGAPSFMADVAILDGRIAKIGRITDPGNARVFDATGMVVSPGFIDMMGQTAAPFLEDPSAGWNLLTQGITTINAGEGGSDAPLAGQAAERAGWSTMREFFARLESHGIPINVAQNIGHTQVRRLVIGDVDRQATPAELERMRGMVREAMEAGAIGLSTSLIYPPAIYASEEEIAALARVAGEYGGRYFTHMRNEGDRLLEAIDEALRIGDTAGTPVHIYHLKAAGQANWPKMDLALSRIRAARKAGQDVAVDVYPYVNNGLGIRALIHPRHSAEGQAALLERLNDASVRAEMRREMEEMSGWENWYAHAGKDWDRIVLGDIEHQAYTQYNGSTTQEVADAEGKDAWDVFFEIARVGAFAMPQTMLEANKFAAMRAEFTSFDTDVGPAGGSRIASHPRGYGSYPRILARYVSEFGVMTLEEAIHKMSGAAANEILAFDRGVLAPGLAADVVVFDPDRIRDRATFGEPTLVSEGVHLVVVNGEVVLENGRQTDARPGRVLRGPGYRK